MKSRRADLTGCVFGRLTVLMPAQAKPKKPRWLCQCLCGKTKVILGESLKSGHTHSCGCLQKEWVRQHRSTHGEAYGSNKTREYRSWQHAKGRCETPTDSYYRHYGGRGIRMCERWRESFQAFLADMGRCPVGHSLDRIDNNGPYAPDNCRWATRAQQMNNTSRNRALTLNHETRHISEWAKLTGLPCSVLCQRLDKLGWSVERALTTPKRKMRRQ